MEVSWSVVCSSVLFANLILWVVSTKPDLSELRALLPHEYASTDKISDVITKMT